MTSEGPLLGSTDVKYGLFDEAWSGFTTFLAELIQQEGAHRVCDVGGGAKPALELSAVRDMKLDYSVLDISAEELAKAPDGYHKLLGDIASPELALEGSFDLVFSKMLAEHVQRPEAFHRNIHRMLRDGGVAFHFFPTLYHPAFVLNRLMPTEASMRLLRVVQDGRHASGRHAKFPAYYRWCRGPTDRQRRRLERVGYRVVEYRGYFGTKYLEKIGPLHALDKRVARGLVRRPVPMLTSFAYVVLRKV